MFGCMAMNAIQPLLLNAVEDRLGKKPREVLEYLLKDYRRQVSKSNKEALQLSFEKVFQLLSQAQEELGGQSWFDMFVTQTNEASEKDHTEHSSKKLELKEIEPLSKKAKPEETQGWFDFYCTIPAEVMKTDKASMDIVPTGNESKLDGFTAFDRRLYFLMDVFSGLSV